MEGCECNDYSEDSDFILCMRTLSIYRSTYSSNIILVWKLERR